MFLPLAGAAWLLLCAQDVLGLAIQQVPRAEDLKAAAAEIKPRLSANAVITLPDDAKWDQLQIRGSSPRVSPDYSVVVEVATESDVTTTVSLAAKYGIPFLAVSGTHGWTETLNRLPYGIQINMRKLNSINVNKDGKSATLGGGALQWEITRALFAKGKYAVTGLAECVSGIGPLMGGGHSLLQNQYGYALDNLVSARVVLANGTLVEASSSKNTDLFWALRGAGHNFGIVTSYIVKAYDVPSTWTVYSLIFTTDKLESVFSLINKFEDPSTPRPTKLALTGVFARIPGIDASSPVLAYTVAYEGPKSAADPYAAQFQALGPASTTITENVDYVQLYTVTGNNLDSQACVRNNNILGSGLMLPKWNLDGVRKAFSIFNTTTLDPRFSASIVLLENYGMKGVRAVPADSTALPPDERTSPILASPVLWWQGENAQTTKDARAAASAMRNALYTGVTVKRHAYVNYAIGDESKEEMYGYESWRQTKLKTLKQAWDPKNAFKFYNPIV